MGALDVASQHVNPNILATLRPRSESDPNSKASGYARRLQHGRDGGQAAAVSSLVTLIKCWVIHNAMQGHIRAAQQNPAAATTDKQASAARPVQV